MVWEGIVIRTSLWFGFDAMVSVNRCAQSERCGGVCAIDRQSTNAHASRPDMFWMLVMACADIGGGMQRLRVVRGSVGEMSADEDEITRDETAQLQGIQLGPRFSTHKVCILHGMYC